jgi:hypothetical protein
MILLILSVTGYGEQNTVPKILRINVPESVSYGGMFEPILKKYAEHWEIARIKTVDLGAVYEVSYKLDMKDGIDEKAMIDELRVLNGNLNIILVLDARTVRSNERGI